MAAEPVPSRPGCGQWLAFAGLVAWLALAPLLVLALLSALFGNRPGLLVELGLLAPAGPSLTGWAFGLLGLALSLAAHLIVFVPLYLSTHRPDREFLHTSAVLLLAVTLTRTLQGLAVLPRLGDSPELALPTGALQAASRLALVLPFLLFGLAQVERQGYACPLPEAWRRMGLRRKRCVLAAGPALTAGAVVVWPWALVGSLGSPGAAGVSLLHAAGIALGEEVLFRGVALAWLWRAGQSRTAAAAGSLALFIAAQGSAVLSSGDWSALTRFAVALLVGILLTELTVRAGGSIWPAVIVHLLVVWFPHAFADPRSQLETLHWLVRMWAPLAAGGAGFLLWAVRKILHVLRAVRQAGGRGARTEEMCDPEAPPLPADAGSRRGGVAAGALAAAVWAVVALLYITRGAPGFHPDGFLIVLKEQAQLGPATALRDPIERRAWVYRELTSTAERSQSRLRSELDRLGVQYRPHYLLNAIEVQERPGLRRAFARDPAVATVLFLPGVRPYPYTMPTPGMDSGLEGGVEWNVREIGADRVWALGYTGQGIVVGDADTGVAWKHPALRAAYLGWEAGRAAHDYHWYDPWDGRSEPWDDSGHGTHTTGTMVGQEGATQVGVAPGARWIACRNMRHGIGNPGSYLSCMEFFLAPFPLGGDPFREGDPARGAHVVNNSWGCPAEEGCRPDTLRLAADNLRAAGQMLVASAGNGGPACGTVQDPPAVYDAVFSVGATGPGERAAAFSSRGPATSNGGRLLKPDLVAPGVDIRSAVPGGYASLPGTSMAGPHVAGAVALLWSAAPHLIGDVDRTEALLVETARPMRVDAVCAVDTTTVSREVCGCGDDTPSSVPNQVYGWGQVDVEAAVRRALEGR